MTHDSRGHYGIAMVDPQHMVNVGSVARATGCFDADYMATVGCEYESDASAVGHDRHTPIWQFETFSDLYESLPYNTTVVAIDYDDDATPLSDHPHPERALYLLGEEGSGFENYPEVLSVADEVVYIESEYCMNVSVAGNMVLRDRYRND